MSILRCEPIAPSIAHPACTPIPNLTLKSFIYRFNNLLLLYFFTVLSVSIAHNILKNAIIEYSDY